MCLVPESGNQALFPEYGKRSEMFLQREVLCSLPKSLFQEKQGKRTKERYKLHRPSSDYDPARVSFTIWCRRLYFVFLFSPFCVFPSTFPYVSSVELSTPLLTCNLVFSICLSLMLEFDEGG